MDKPPLFVQCPQEARKVFARLKMMRCPHCGVTNRLIRNGRLKGCDPHHYGDTTVVRGQRLRCSARGHFKGCGRSSSIFFKWIMPGFTIDARLMAAFLLSISAQTRVHCAWLGMTRYFSLSSAYRWWRRLRREQPRLRQMLCRRCQPPPCSSREPRNQLIEHLIKAFGDDSIAGYQMHFQSPILS